MKKPLTVLLILGLLVLLVGIVAVSAAASKTVYTRGDETVQINALISSNLRFSPGPVTVSRGDTVAWIHDDKTEAPHTVSVVNAADLPQEFLDVFLCGEPGGPCENFLIQHLGLGNRVLDNGVPVNPNDPIVLDGEGDSFLFFHGETFEATIDAPAGTTLAYICALHPWMQGTIRVKD